jgi:hypothetical protein
VNNFKILSRLSAAAARARLESVIKCFIRHLTDA